LGRLRKTCTILMISHRPEDAGNVDVVLTLKKSRIEIEKQS
jgi:ABC-type transport system involved in cytochrome bd biosynthesis fused ATPase/permease subunit